MRDFTAISRFLFFLISVLCLNATVALAQNYQTRGNATWNVSSNWSIDGGVTDCTCNPAGVVGANVRIMAGHTAAVANAADIGLTNTIDIQTNGTLQLDVKPTNPIATLQSTTGGGILKMNTHLMPSVTTNTFANNITNTILVNVSNASFQFIEFDTNSGFLTAAPYNLPNLTISGVSNIEAGGDSYPTYNVKGLLTVESGARFHFPFARLSIDGNASVDGILSVGNAASMTIASTSYTTINPSGTMSIGSNGLTIQGTLENLGTFVTNNFVTVEVQSGGVVLNKNSMTVNDDTFVIRAGGIVNNQGSLSITNTFGRLNVEGTFNQQAGGVVSLSGGAIATFTNTATYNHERDGGDIPTTTWGASSNCNVTGITFTPLGSGSFGQTFGNFTWNCTGQVAGQNTGLGGAMTVAGNFTVRSIGTSSNLTFARPLNIAGDFDNQVGISLNLDAVTTTFNGGATQTISGGSGVRFYNLTISQSPASIVDVTSSNLIILNALDLNEGRIRLNNTDLSFAGAASNITRTNGWVETNGTGINGFFIYNSGSAATNVLFPVGDATNYQPISIADVSASGALVRFGQPLAGAGTVPNSGVGSWFVNNFGTTSDIILLNPQGGTLTWMASRIATYATAWTPQTTFYPTTDYYQSNIAFSGVVEIGVFSCSTISLDAASLTNGTQNAVYSTEYRAITGGTFPYTVAVTFGALPLGMTATTSGSDVVIDGTPTTVGTFNFELTVTDANTCTSTAQAYSLTIDAPTPIISIADGGFVNEDIYKTLKQKIYTLQISASASTDLTSLSIPMAGTYTASDIDNFKLYHNTVNDFATATPLSTAGASTGAGETINFTGFSETLSGGSPEYFYLVADISSGAATGNTISINVVIPFANFGFSNTVTMGGTSYGFSGTKTIQPLPTIYQTLGNATWNVSSNWSLDGGVTDCACSPAGVTGANVRIMTGHTVTVSGNLDIEIGNIIEIQGTGILNLPDGNGNAIATLTTSAGSTINLNGGSLNLVNPTTTTINGTLNFNTGGTVPNGMTFAGGSSYNHGIDGGTIPTASWATTSTVNITGVTNTMPTGFNQTFGNLTWNSTGQAGLLGFNANMTVLETLSILSTGSGSNALYVVLDNTTDGIAHTITTNHFVQTGDSKFGFANTAFNSTGTLEVSGNFSQTGTGGYLSLGSASFSGVANNNLVFTGGDDQNLTITDFAVGSNNSFKISVNKTSGKVNTTNTTYFPSLTFGSILDIVAGNFSLNDGVEVHIGELQGSGTLTLLPNSIFYLYGGNHTFTGTLAADASSAVSYDAVGNIFAPSSGAYGNINLRGSGNYTLSGNITVDSNIRFVGINGTVVFGASPITLTVNGDVENLFSSTVNLNMTGAAHTLNLNGAGNAVNSLITDTNNSQVVYGRSGNQSVFGSPNYRNLEIAGSDEKALQGAVTVANILTLTSGRLRLGANNITLSGAIGTQIAAGGSGWVETDGAGRLVRQGSGIGTFDFPVGNSTTKQAIQLSEVASGATVGFVPTPSPNFYSSGSPAREITGMWEVTQGAATTGTTVVLKGVIPPLNNSTDDKIYQKTGISAGDWTQIGTGGTSPDLATVPFNFPASLETFAAFTPFSAPNIVINTAPTVPANNVLKGTTNNILYQFSAAVTSSDATLTEVKLTTGGTYATSDITNLKLRYSTDAILDVGDATFATITSPPTAGVQTFTGSQLIPVGTGYFFLTADIGAGASVGNTINIEAPAATADFNFGIGTVSFFTVTSTGGTQTIIASPQPLGNRGIYFDRVDDYVEVGNVLGTTFQTEFTAEAWIKPTFTGTDRWNAILSKWRVADGASDFIFTHIENSGNSFLLFADVDGTNITTPLNSITFNKWHHVAVVYTQTPRAYAIYIDGVLQNSGTSTALQITNNNSIPLRIGAMFNGAAPEAVFSGQIDEVRIFNTARTVTEIQTDIATQTANGGVAYWNFDDDVTAGNQSVAVNSGTNGATLNGNLGTAPNNPLWAFRVKNTNDSGAESLRQAITDANTDTDTDYIDFSIQQTNTSAVSTVTLASNLPTIDQSTVLDAYSAYGSSPNTGVFGAANNAQLRVEINANGVARNAFEVGGTATNVVIKGFSIYGATNTASPNDGAIHLLGDNNRVEGCYIGLTASGTIGTPANQRQGIAVNGFNNIVGWSGTLDVGKFNVISGATTYGVDINGDNNILQGNYIGTNPAGTTDIPNTTSGVFFSGNTNQVLNNVISGNTLYGIISAGGAFTGNVFQGNRIGTKADGASGLANGLYGIRILSGNTANNTIGGTGAGEGNTIAYNGVGISIGNSTLSNRISGNNIFANTTVGIELATGGNANKAVPVVSSATLSLISGTCELGDVVEVFNDTPQSGTTDQGRTFLGTATVVGTNWTYSGTFTTGDRITATATSAANNTSPFAVAAVVTSPSSFITTWKTDNAGTSASNQILIPLDPSANYNFTVNWGDGNTNTFTGLGSGLNPIHTYVTAGTYTVSISGTFPRIFFNNAGDRLKILSIEQWGNIAWTSMNLAFSGCTNLTYTATDVPNLAGVTDLSFMFQGCTAFNGNATMGTWNVSNVTTFEEMFRDAAAFNQNIGAWAINTVSPVNMQAMFNQATAFNNGDIAGQSNNPLSWDVSRVTNMNSLFRFIPAFNQNINTWNVTNVTDFSGMFFGATAFNQPLNNWVINTTVPVNMSSMFNQATVFNQDITGWDVSRVTDMSSMFRLAANFNQNISTWNVSNVTNMSTMFFHFGAGAFNQNIGSWTLRTAGVTMTNMLDNCGMSQANYEATLIGWSGPANPTGVNLGAAGRTYCSAAAVTARANLTGARGWTISGDALGGCVIPTQPLGNRGMYFDGVDDRVVTASISDFNFQTGDYTLEAWIKPQATGTIQRIISRDNWSWGLESDGTLLMSHLGITDYNIGAVSLPLNKWSHFAVSRTMSGLTFYVNGAVVGTGGYTPIADVTSSILTIGSRVDGSQRYNGQIDEVRIFSSARTLAEIQADMASTTPNGAVGYWNFDEGTGTTANDLGSGSNNGTLTNNPLWALRVTNTFDDGSVGSLRWTINEANTDADKDYIDFSIPTAGVQTIAPATSDLPSLSTPVIIDGYSQENSTKNTLAAGINANLLIEIRGSATRDRGLNFVAGSGGSEVYGLVVNGFTLNGFASGIATSTSDITIAGCFIGTDATGTTAIKNSRGISAFGATTNLTLGLPTNEGRNLISGNEIGVGLDGSSGNLVRNNYIGTAVSGTAPLGNTVEGLLLFGSNAVIGGNTVAARNVIGANGQGNITLIFTNAQNNTIIGNYVGVGADGVAALGGGSLGNIVWLSDGISNTTIGGIAAGEGNLIANSGTGVAVRTGATSLNNKIRGNSIYNNSVGIDNGFDGITANDANDGDSGPNKQQNYPVITSALISGTDLSVSYTVDASTSNSTYPLSIDIYKSEGGRQGKVYLGSTTYTSVEAQTSVTQIITPLATINPSDIIVLTATDADGNTSEFSAEQTVAAPVIPAQPLGNRGIYFDGVDDKVVTNTFSLNDFTIEFWIKTKQTGSASADPNWYNGFGLVDADQSGSGDDFGVSLADGKIRFGIANIATAETTLESNATPLVNDGAWHHIAAVRNNTTNTLQIYIDGVLNNSTTAVATGAVGVAPLTFGASANSGGFFNGQLDEVRVFNTVRTAAQIATDMAAQAANGAVAYWNLDQSTGTTANDLSGNANNGTLQNGTLWALRVTDNTDNSGAGLGSLRQAITEANTDTDTDYIDFSIQQANTATVSTITMADLGGGIQNALPVITESIFIDGYSAYGSSPNTANFLAPNNAQIRIELDCQYIGIPPTAMPPLSSGLELNASNSTLRGLSIYGVTAGSWGSQFGINIGSGSNNIIAGNYIGLKADGTATANGNCGLGILAGTNNLIGGLTDGTANSQFNIISKHDRDGMQINGSSNTIQGNYIGTDKTGNLTGFGNAGRGVNLTVASNNVIGNLIAGNSSHGVIIQVNANNSVVKGNYIGIRADLSAGLPNGDNGILVTTEGQNTTGSTIGTVAEPNTIAYNANYGISVAPNNAGANTANGHKISGNNIFGNTTGGIFLGGNPIGNNNKAVPIISSATTMLISGTCESGDVVEIFNDTPQSGTTDQGRAYLGNATVVGTSWTYSGTFTLGDRITATATSAANNTSPFAVAAIVASPLSINTLNPVRNALNIATNAPIITNLSTTVVTPTLNNQIKVIGSQTGFYTAGAISGTNPVTIPAQNFKAGETITVQYLTTLLGTGGETLVSPQQYQFTAAATGVGNFELSDFNLGANLRNVRVADMNNDNKLDLIFTNVSPTPNQIRVYLNNGAGSYTLSGDYGGASPNGISRLVVSDFNADGFMDVAATNYGGQNVTILIGDGFGGFSSVSNTAGLGSVLTGCIGGDFDGDGDIDLAVSKGATDEVAILLNNGSGVFALSGAYLIPSSGANPIDLFAGDLDNDGDLDIASSNFSNSNCAIFLNNGSAVFTVSIFSTGAAGNMQGIDGKDLDNDGDIDLAVTSVTASKDVRFFSNNGSGVFTAAGAVISTSGGDPYDVRIGDMDGDGIPDVLVSSNTENKLYYLKNNGSFSFTQALFNSPNGGTFLDVGDMDGDDDLDVITDYGTGFSVFLNKAILPTITSFTPTSGIVGTTVTITGLNFNATPANNSVYFGAIKVTPTAGSTTSLTVTVPVGATSVTPITVVNNANGLQGNSMETITGTTVRQFTVTNTPTLTPNYTKIDFTTGGGPAGLVLKDFNGDGFADIATANPNADNVSVLLGTGTGTFGAATNYAVGDEPFHAVASGDFNNDGNIDLVVPNYGTTNNVSVLLGTGTGTFGAATNFTVGTKPAYVAVGDFNDDGKLDLVTANNTSNNVSILLGTGTGTFGAATNFATQTGPWHVAVGDFNNDGNSDLAVSTLTSSGVSILLGNGAGSFGAFTDFVVGIGPRAVEVGDFNNDGNLDLVTANYNSQNASVILGNGAGSFGSATTLAIGGSSFPQKVRVADFNGDGNRDIAVTSYFTNLVSMFLGDGAGGFGTVTNFTVNGAPVGLEVADVNGDGKTDIIVANELGNNVSVLLYTSPTPVALAATAVTSTGFTANWTVTTGNYEIDITNDPTFTAFTTVTSTTNSRVFTGFTAETAYYYRVRNFGDVVNSSIRTVFLPPTRGAGRALDLTAANTYVQSDKFNNTFGSAEFTIEAWIKDDGGVDRTIAHSSALTTLLAQHNYWRFYISTGDLHLDMGNSGVGVTQATSGVAIPAGQWTHVAVTRNAAGDITFYVNGIPYLGGNTTIDASNGGTLRIGATRGSINIPSANASDVPTNKLNGEIDELRIWNTILSQGNIRNNMCQKLVGNEANLLGYFRFDEASGATTENRATASDFEGTLVNAPTRVNSGAAIGDVSTHRYTTAGTASLADFSAFFGTGGINRGIQVYKINESPNATAVNPSAINTLETSQYFGVFGVNTPFNVTYNYTSNTNINGVANEPQARLYNRFDGTIATWTGVAGSTINTATKTITLAGQSTNQFIAGFRTFVSVLQPGAGKALSFNGTNQYVDLGLGLGLGLAGSSFTMEAWVKIPSNSFTHQNTILGKNINAGTISYRFDIDNSGRLGIRIGDGTNVDAFLAPTPITPNQWTHVAAVFDNTTLPRTIKLYINGVLGNTLSPATVSGLVSSPLPTYIGSLNLGAANYFEGEIDEVRIWNVARTQAQLRDDMCQKIATPLLLPDLLGYYRLDEGAGAATEDRSSIFNDGTLVNSPTWITSGAALGDISAHSYDLGINVGVADTDLFTASFVSTPLLAGQGVHVYKVREAPNDVALPAGIAAFESTRYFGIYKVNFASNVDISYKYDANTNINGTIQEFSAIYSEREDNAASAWSTPLPTNFGITPPSNKFLTLSTPITNIQKELIVGFTSVAPAIQATNIVFSALTSISVNLQWTNGNGTNRIVVMRTDNNFVAPTDGTAYNVGDIIGGGTVVYNGSGNFFTANGLTPKTKYFFFVYEYSIVSLNPVYNIIPALNNPLSIGTIATAPANQPTNLTTTSTPTGLSGSFTPAVPAADGYIGMLRTPDSQAVPPTDGANYNVGTLFPPSQTVVFVGNNASFNIVGLQPATEYILEIYAYNGADDKIAYKKDSPLTIKFTTPALVPQLISITPSLKSVGDKGFILQAIGKDFIPKTTLRWAGRDIPTNFISKTELSATIEESLLLDAGSYPVTATSPAPGGGISNALPFTVIPLVAIKNIPLISKTVAPDKNDHLLYRLEFISYGGETILKQLKISAGGSYRPADLKNNAFTLYYSTDDNLDGGDINLGTLPAIPSGLSMIFDVSKLVNRVRFPKNRVAHLLIAVNIAKEPTLGREIQLNSLKLDDIEFEGIVTKQGLDPTQAGVPQKIVDAKPTPQDYSALVQFFNDMKGKDWVNTWDLNAPVNTWRGVELDENGNVIAISLANNNLVGKLSDAVMIDGILISKSLRYINLSGNKIEGTMPINIGNLTNLEYLDISNNSIIGQLPTQIGKLVNLITLWAGNNQLGSINIDFSNMRNLRNLFLSANNLTSLPDNLSDLKQLEILDLRGNKLKTLPLSIGELTKLKFLDVSNNELIELPQGVSKLSDLEVFLAHSNRLPSLPTNLTNLAKLQQFTIESNFLTFGTLETIQQWWSSTSKTKVIYSPQGKIGKVQEITAPVGTSITLNIITSGSANTYQWLKNGKPINNTNTPSYSISSIVADDGGIYTVNVISALVPNLVLQSNDIILFTDCSKSEAAPKPAISVSGSVVFCGSEPVNTRLSVAESSGLQPTGIRSYKWFLNGIEINNSDRSSILARDAGRYRVQVQTTSGCSLISDDLPIFLFPEYTVSITQTQEILNANVANRSVVSFEWFLGGNLIQGATGQTFTPQEAGAYSVRTTDINGCRATSLPIRIANVTSVEDNVYERQLIIYPNPSKEIFFLEVGSLASKEKIDKIEIFNALGKFFNQHVSLINTNKYMIDLGNQAAGVYFVRITTSKGSIIQKIIKE